MSSTPETAEETGKRIALAACEMFGRPTERGWEAAISVVRIAIATAIKEAEAERDRWRTRAQENAREGSDYANRLHEANRELVLARRARDAANARADKAEAAIRALAKPSPENPK